MSKDYNLKRLTNDFTLYGEFQLFLKSRLEQLHKDLEVVIEPRDVYVIQGQIKEIRRLEKLKERVDAGTT